MTERSPRSRPDETPAEDAEPAPSSADTTPEVPTPTELHDPDYHALGSTRVLGDESAPPPAPPARKAATSLGDFQLLKKIGEGAMGAVYKARQRSFQRDVALKVLFRHVANNPKLVERLYREGRAMGQLDHPNIVQAFAVGEDQGCHYVAMEYVDGQSMQKWLARVGRLSVADAVRVTLDCARALDYAHAQGMVHRDIKPDNILVTSQGAVKVADLGMVKTFDDDLGLTQTGHAVGTPWYMPLEQAKNAKDTDGRSDIYALGCTLYCLLTGAPPFAGKTIIEVVQAKEVGSFPPARRSNPDVPERLDLLIAKMTAKQPQYRYQTCAELIKDLESLQLAGETLSFLHEGASAKPGLAVSVPSSPSIDINALPSQVEIDLDVWYVRLKGPDGQVSLRKYTTAKLQKLLADGTIDPKTKASHSPKDGFRALGTYKEFESSAFHKATRKAADKASSQYRNLYEKIEEKERRRERENVADDGTWKHWLGVGLKVGGVLLGLLLLALFFYYVGTGLGGK